MGITLFKRPASRKETSLDSEFAATVATLPPGEEAAIPLPPAGRGGGGPDSLPPPDSQIDSQPFDSQPFDAQDSQPPDSLPPEALLPGAAGANGTDAPPKAPPGPFDPHPPQELPAYLGGQPARAPAATPAPAPEDASALPMADQPTIAQVGRYALKRHLGVGGLGQVHEAWDPLLSRTVAIKTLQFESDPRTRNSLDRLFLNEARAVAGLSHPNIVTVYDAGLSPSGVYLAMERLQGKDLRQRLSEGWKPGPAVVAQLVRRVADALAYAHARGVVHCDIKPGNIFITGSDKPKVLDFGIARVAHGRAVPAALQGTVAGSPHYLAPEQLLGKEVDARTDVYSLGVVFYELLSGRRAFAGDSVEQITTAVLTNHPAPAHLIRAGVPEALSAIAARAMARDPEARYATASEMAADIRSWFEQPRTAAAPSARAERAEARRARKAEQVALRGLAPTPRRWPWAVGGALAAVLALVGIGLVLVLRPSLQSPAARTTAVPAAPAATAAAPATAPHTAAAREGDVVMSGGVPVVANAAAAPATLSGATAAAPGTAAAESPTQGNAGAPAHPAATAPGNALLAQGGGAASPAATAAAPSAHDAAATQAATAKPASAAQRQPAPAATTARAGSNNPRDAASRRGATPPAAGAATGAAAAATTGALHLAITPWGQVEIDGQGAGTTPPLTQLTLPTGAHSITIRNADFPPFSTTVQVQADKPVVVRHRFGGQ
ncbi:MAG: serine/threonine protein kinase [Rubrivivax sp.]|nr:serine/threonine protein kinase [Rubrivivax sp.]